MAIIQLSSIAGVMDVTPDVIGSEEFNLPVTKDFPPFFNKGCLQQLHK